MTLRWICGISILSVLMAFTWRLPAHAHGGGTPRLAGGQAGPYLVYAWSEPQPLRQGETHLTVGVTVPSTESDVAGEEEKPVTDAEVTVTYNAVNGASEPVVMIAEPQDSLGIVYYEADGTVPAAGLWRVDVAVLGSLGEGVAAFEVNVTPARQTNRAVIATAGSAIVLGLLALAWRARHNGPSAAHRSATSKRSVAAADRAASDSSTH